MSKFLTIFHKKNILISSIGVCILALLVIFYLFFNTSQPVHLVLISILSIYTLLLFLFFYRFVFPKKNIPFITLVILLSLLPLVSILRPGPYESGDFQNHVQIAMGFDQSLREGNILPRWNDNSCGRFGCPDFIFLFILPYYLLSLIHLFGFSFIASLKIYLILAFIASGISMYLWLKDSFDAKSALVGSIFYQFAPYHLVDLHFRNDIGEVLSFAIYPVIFLFVKRLVDTGKLFYSLLFAIFATLLLISHTTMFYSAIPLASIYFVILWFQKKKRNVRQFLQLILALLITFLLSMFYWLPLISQAKLIHYGNTTYINLLSIQEILFSPWRYGLLFQGHHGELSYVIGYAQLLFIIFSIYLFIKKKIKTNRLLYGYFIISIFMLSFLLLNASRYFWYVIPFLDKFEESHRFLLPINFLIAGIIGITGKYIKKNYILVFFCVLAIITTMLNWGNRGTLPKVTDTQLQNDYRIDSNGHNSVSPIWVDTKATWSLKRPHQPMQTIQGQAIIQETKRMTNMHSYEITAKTPVLLKENTYYFPGWNVFIDGMNTPINYKNKYFPGLIVFPASSGKHHISVAYTTIEIQQISNIISLFVLGCILCYFVILFIKRKRLVIRKQKE